MKINKITPILIVELIEPLIPFWTRLGFSKSVEVPHGEKLGFVILSKDNMEVMLQSYSSLAEDLPDVAKLIENQLTIQYMEVDSIDEVIATIDPHTIIVKLRTTFYGSKEIFVADPAGYIIGFSEKENN